MTPEELRENSDLHALGLLDADERAELRSAAAADPQAASAAARSSAAMVAQFSAFTKMVDPPKRLRERVIRMVAPSTEKKSGFGWGLVFASAAVMLFALSGLLAYQINRLSVARRADSARFATATALMAAPDTREVVFGNGTPQPPKGRVFVNRSKGVVLLASNLAQLGADKIYEMWVIPKGQKPVPAGLFRSQRDGTALHYQDSPVDPDSIGAVAVTVEPALGSDQPSTTPIIVAPIAP